MQTKRQRAERAIKESYWRPHITSWERSGQSVKGYCQAHQLVAHQFNYWRYQLTAKTKESSTEAQTEETEFVELKPLETISTLPLDICCEIKTERGMSVTVKGSIDMVSLQQLLATLQATS